MYNYNDLPAYIIIPMLDLYKYNRSMFPRTNLSDEERVREVFITGVWDMMPSYVHDFFYPEIAKESYILDLLEDNY